LVGLADAAELVAVGFCPADAKAELAPVAVTASALAGEDELAAAAPADVPGDGRPLVAAGVPTWTLGGAKVAAPTAALAAAIGPAPRVGIVAAAGAAPTVSAAPAFGTGPRVGAAPAVAGSAATLGGGIALAPLLAEPVGPPADLGAF
jgi:hypothetical protein